MKRLADGTMGYQTQQRAMTDPDRVRRFLRTKLRGAGEQFEEAKRAYASGRAVALADLPTDGNGDAKLVCRRHAEERAVALDADTRPECYEAGHTDCEGCVEDIRDGSIETW